MIKNYISNNDIITMQQNFQDGVDAVYNACVAKGSTPASHSLSDVISGIGNIKTNISTEMIEMTAVARGQTKTFTLDNNKTYAISVAGYSSVWLENIGSGITVLLNKTITIGGGANGGLFICKTSSSNNTFNIRVTTSSTGNPASIVSIAYLYLS